MEKKTKLKAKNKAKNKAKPRWQIIYCSGNGRWIYGASFSEKADAVECAKTMFAFGTDCVMVKTNSFLQGYAPIRRLKLKA